MQQRRVRLGDIVDDYCPRERRVTNHAVVAMIEDQVKQTRCVTCDADHEYKQGRAPASRRRKSEGVLVQQEPPGTLGQPRHTASSAEVAVEPDAGEVVQIESPAEIATVEIAEVSEPLVVEAAQSAQTDTETLTETETETEDERERPEDQWVHRRLIRAQLPRPEGQLPERKATDFTVQPNTDRDGNRIGHRQRGPRSARPHGQGQSSPGQRPGGGNQRQGGAPGQGNQRQGGGNRPGSPGGPRGGGRPDNEQRRGPQGSGSGRRRGR